MDNLTSKNVSLQDDDGSKPATLLERLAAGAQYAESPHHRKTMREAYEALSGDSSATETKAFPPLCDGAVQVIYERGEPSGVRDATGYLCFFNRVTKWPGQEERYRQELALRARHAEVIANALRGVQETSTKSYRPCGCEGEACKGHPENGKGD